MIALMSVAIETQTLEIIIEYTCLNMECFAGVGRCFADLEIIDGIRSAVCGATRLLNGPADIVSRPVAEGQSVRVCGAVNPTCLPKELQTLLVDQFLRGNQFACVVQTRH